MDWRIIIRRWRTSETISYSGPKSFAFQVVVHSGSRQSLKKRRSSRGLLILRHNTHGLCLRPENECVRGKQEGHSQTYSIVRYKKLFLGGISTDSLRCSTSFTFLFQGMAYRSSFLVPCETRHA